MAWIPKFKLYQSDGTTLVHTFSAVQATNAPQSVKDMIEITNPRGKGSIIIDGGQAPWDLIITGILYTTETAGDAAYKDLTNKIETMENISIGTPYVLTLDKDETSYFSYNVKRIEPIEYEEDNLRIGQIEYRCTLRANSW